MAFVTFTWYKSHNYSSSNYWFTQWSLWPSVCKVQMNWLKQSSAFAWVGITSSGIHVLGNLNYFNYQIWKHVKTVFFSLKSMKCWSLWKVSNSVGSCALTAAHTLWHLSLSKFSEPSFHVTHDISGIWQPLLAKKTVYFKEVFKMFVETQQTFAHFFLDIISLLQLSLGAYRGSECENVKCKAYQKTSWCVPSKLCQN